MQTDIWNSASHIQPFFTGGKPTGTWRKSDMFFKPTGECRSSAPGLVDMSPGWFEQAHDVRFPLSFTS